MSPPYKTEAFTRESEVNLPPEFDTYQAIVARSGYLEGITFHIALGNESIDKALLPGIGGIISIAISTSISSVSCVVDAGDTEPTLDALNQAFEAPQQVKKRPKTY